MAYKEMKLEPGEAQGLYDLWNSGMTGGGKKKPATAKKKDTPAKKTEKKSEKKPKK